MNEYDSGRISDFTKAINYRKTENFKEADCFVLNTCHIREKATEKMFHEIGRIKKEYKHKKKPIVLGINIFDAQDFHLIMQHHNSLAYHFFLFQIF